MEQNLLTSRLAFMVIGAFKRPQLKKKSDTKNSVTMFLFLHSYDITLVAKNKQIACGRPFFIFLKLFFKISRSSTLCSGRCPPRFYFMLWTLGDQNIAKIRYMKCTFCLGLVGARYPSELELKL